MTEEERKLLNKEFPPETRMQFDLDGNPIGLGDYCAIRESEDWKLAQEYVNGWFVSTIWLGVNHTFGSSPPVIFETMVFPDCTICARYSTREEALAGHKEIVEKVRGWLPEGGLVDD